MDSILVFDDFKKYIPPPITKIAIATIIKPRFLFCLVLFFLLLLLFFVGYIICDDKGRLLSD